MPIHLRGEPGDYADACLLPGDPLRAKYIAETYLTDARRVNEERGLLGYTGSWEGKQSIRLIASSAGQSANPPINW